MPKINLSAVMACVFLASTGAQAMEEPGDRLLKPSHVIPQHEMDQVEAERAVHQQTKPTIDSLRQVLSQKIDQLVADRHEPVTSPSGVISSPGTPLVLMGVDGKSHTWDVYNVFFSPQANQENDVPLPPGSPLKQDLFTLLKMHPIEVWDGGAHKGGGSWNVILRHKGSPLALFSLLLYTSGT